MTCTSLRLAYSGYNGEGTTKTYSIDCKSNTEKDCITGATCTELYSTECEDTDNCYCCTSYGPKVDSCPGGTDFECQANSLPQGNTYASYLICASVGYGTGLYGSTSSAYTSSAYTTASSAYGYGSTAAYGNRRCRPLAACAGGAHVNPQTGLTETLTCPNQDSTGCDSDSDCSERDDTQCEDYSSQCDCCSESESEPTTCLVDADCSASSVGATACGTPKLNGAPIPGAPSACVSPQLCGIETTFGTETATMSCGASKLALYVAAAAAAAYMAV